MRTFVDEHGGKWDVVVGRESWGAVYALFIPEEGEGTMRQAILATSSYQEAGQQLEEAPEAELSELFRRSEPKSMD